MYCCIKGNISHLSYLFGTIKYHGFGVICDVLIFEKDSGLTLDF